MRKGKNNIEHLEESVIRAAYGEAGFREKRMVNKLVRSDEKIATLYRKHAANAAALHSSANIKCPDGVTENVLANTLGSKKRKRNFLSDLYPVFFERPIIPAAAALLVLAVTLLLLTGQNNMYGNYTETEVRNAEKEAKYSLMLVNEIFSDARTTIETKVIKNTLSEPINRGFETVNYLFNTGETK